MTDTEDPHFAAILSSERGGSCAGSDLPPQRRNERKGARRRSRNPRFSGFGVRLRREGVGSGRRAGPATPLLRWKFDDGDVSVDAGKSGEVGGRGRRKEKNGDDVLVSARKLAAGLWHLMVPEVSGFERSKGSLPDQLAVKPAAGHITAPGLHNTNNAEYDAVVKHHIQSPLSVPNQKNGVLYKLEPTVTFPNPAMERATKWDPAGSKTPENMLRFYGQLKLLEDQQISTISVVSTLQAELEQARTRIHELETERRTSKKKLDHFLKKLSEERTVWRSREHEKVRAVIEDVKDDLNRERKNRQRMEIMNSKLVNELAEAKLSAKRFLQDYEKERKGRELMEEVCDELAKEIAEDKAELEVHQRESAKVREEMEEERKMLQMAEVWREERVQMKLIDAKLTLEDKYSQLNKLIFELESFLRSRSSSTDVKEIREAELLKEVASSVHIQDIKEFTYQPPTSEDIFSVIEDLQSGNAHDREIEACYGYSPASRASKIHTVSPEINGIDDNRVQRYGNGCIDRHGEIDEDGSEWETVSHGEEHGSSNSPEGSYPSVNGHHDESILSGSGTDWGENGDNETLNTELSEVYSASAKPSKKKSSSISRLWRSAAPNGDNCKTIPVEVMNGRLSNGRLSNGRISTGLMSPDRRSAELGLSPPSAGQWSSPDSANPHITRGMKGCIEWPRSAQKNSLKAKLMEARVESQKIQLRHVLKQKI
ncbi:hypothetical protein H6P81_006950 [Aristolochia fimbriata]|uniref:Uncharacterized protein n=1 Tax=Aristolochia fimbriata TaxID=158543 RepID=A0AAV7F1I3_ARIFI|nr:hypothetical protein H6P81_006950 [Aristolochia fimbriata]